MWQAGTLRHKNPQKIMTYTIEELSFMYSIYSIKITVEPIE